MVGITYAYIDTVFGFVGTLFFSFLFVKYPLLLLSWMFEHDCLDTCCIGVLYTCLVFFYFYLFIAIEHVSHGKVL